MENDTVLTRFNKIFPWYSGLSGDLLFWIAIDTLFLAVVKNFNSSQIVSLTSVSLVTCILLQMPLLKIINKIYNKALYIFIFLYYNINVRIKRNI